MDKNEVRIFPGKHCETTATGTLLNQLGLRYSEPMLFGLGEGLGFIYWNAKAMDFPFLGGRVKPDALTANLARNLDLALAANETSSAAKAWEAVRARLDAGGLVGLKLDSYYLEYFTKPIHFAGHYVAIHGYDEKYAYLVDTEQQGGFVRTTLESLARARNAGGPMSSKNLWYTIDPPRTHVRLGNAILGAIRRNAREFLNPPIQNAGYKGIRKAGPALKKHFEASPTRQSDFRTLAMVMEKAGTGGALFRNFYRDFLLESQGLLGIELLGQCGLAYADIAKKWTRVAGLFDEAGRKDDAAPLDAAKDLLEEISAGERAAMEALGALPESV